MTSAEPRTRRLVYPTARDPRWFVLAFLASFVTFAVTSPGYGRSAAQFAAGMGTCVALDFAVTYFRRGLLLAPLSGLISSMGLLLLCDSPWLWPYPLGALLVIGSKQLLRVDGRHIFNPVNFGVVVLVLLFPHEITIVAARWGGSSAVLAAVSALGLLACWRAGRADVALTYAATFVVGAALRAAVSGAPLAATTAPMTGAAFALFTLFMITDPMTTPESRRGRVLYVVAVGALDSLLRWYEIKNAPFYALFAMSATLPFFRRAFPAATPEVVWQQRERRLAT